MKKGRGVLLDPQTGDLSISVEKDDMGKISYGLTVGDNSVQSQYFVLTAHPGEFKEAPETGVGIGDMALDGDMLGWRTKIRRQLENEGMRINAMEFKNSELLIDAEYK